MNTTLLFIGYETDEAAFRQLHDEISYDLKQHGRRAYALMFTADDWKKATLAAQQIDVIAFEQAATPSEYNRRLTEALETLVQQVEEKRPHHTTHHNEEESVDMFDIFLSYSRKDAQSMQKLRKALDQHGRCR